MFAGYVALGGTSKLPVLAKTSAGVPVNADAAPTFRTYGPDGVMQNGTGTSSFKDTGSVTDATNASPIVVTSVAHKLTTGARVTIAGVGGNTAANGTWVITKVSDDAFSLDGSTGNAAYTSGGTWNVAGLYQAEISALAADGYEAGQSYSVLFTGEISGSGWGELVTFAVV